MNYRHSYHAGNFADVLKHIVLIALLKSFLKKPTPFCYLDTHAGAGFYDLSSEPSKKTNEFEHGILKIMQKKNPPHLVQEYLMCVQAINHRLAKSRFTSLQYYPGSPLIAKYYLRTHDRMILSELHPQEYQLLKNHFKNDMQTSVHLSDAEQTLKAVLPPKERRGLILIDPPYEKPNEFIVMMTALHVALKRFETGIYALWYPIKDRSPLNSIKEKLNRPTLAIELCVYPENTAFQLNGCGMLIVNPPWKFDEEVKEILPWLWREMSIHNQGRYDVKFLFQ